MRFCLLAYTAELIVRTVALQKPMDYFRDFWLKYDLFCVVAMYVEIIAELSGILSVPKLGLSRS